jgi:hypothetical protein
MKINLGSGHKKQKGYINVDINPNVKPDVESDNFEYLKTLKNDIVSKVYSSHYLEHIEPQLYIPFLEELYRVSKNNAIWEFWLPICSNGGLPQGNPLHYRAYWFGHFNSFKPNSKDNYTKIKLIDISPNIPTVKKILLYHFPYLAKKRQIYFKLQVEK